MSKPKSIEGFRIGMKTNASEYGGSNQDIKLLRRKIRETTRMIRARQCLRTKGRVHTKEYKKVRKRMSDKTIVRKYSELKEELGLTEVRKHKLITI